VPTTLQLDVDLLQLRPHPLGNGDALDREPPSSPGPTTDVGQAQEVERLRSTRTPAASGPVRVAAELDQPGLVRVQFQPEPREPFAQLGQELVRILLGLETDDEVVRPPHDDHVTAPGPAPPPLDPQVEDVVSDLRKSANCGALTCGDIMEDLCEMVFKSPRAYLPVTVDPPVEGSNDRRISRQPVLRR
jgi:hypothetical protein